MNLFRSEEHVRNWSGFDIECEGGMISLDDLVRIFSCEVFRRRLEPDYFSHRSEYRIELTKILTEMGKTRPFWSPSNV